MTNPTQISCKASKNFFLDVSNVSLLNNASTLRIVAWNANGIINHRAQIIQFLNDYNIDVMLISETRLTKESYFSIPNYIFYHALHPDNTAHAGAGVLIKRRIKHFLNDSIVKEMFQSVSITISLQQQDLTIAVIYSPPHHNPQEIDYANLIDRLGTRFLIAGDWNAKHFAWGSKSVYTKGRHLLKAIDSLHASIASQGRPTHYPTDPLKNPDVLDFGIYKGFSKQNIHTSLIEDELSSDHIPVHFHLAASPIFTTPPTGLINKATDWECFKDYINERIKLYADPKLDTPQKIDSELENLVKIIQDAAKNATPPPIQHIKAGYKTPPYILKIIKEKRKARKRWLRSRDPEDKAYFNSISRELTNELWTIRNNQLEKFIKTLDASPATDYSLWRAISYIKRPPLHNAPLFNDNTRKWAKTDLHKANLHATHLEKVFKPNSLPNATKRDILLHLNETDLIETEHEIPHFSFGEVTKLISKCKTKKAPGKDQLTGLILKKLPDKAIHKLVQIFNAIINLQYVPSKFKEAIIIVFHKKGKPERNPSSYRPISLLSSIAKLWERLYLPRLLKVINIKNILPDIQFGFRAKHSTIEQIHRVTNFIEKALEKGEYCVSAFLDVAQAFDKVSHKLLIKMLANLLPACHVRLIQSYLSDRTFRVRVGEALSDEKPILAGVPQGSVLGPLLYLLFTSDIPAPTRKSLLGKYADDTTYLSSNKSQELATLELEDNLQNFYNWTSEKDIKLNCAKTIYKIFSNRSIKDINIIFNKVLLKPSEVAKYLGIHLDTKLKWKEHIKIKREECLFKLKKLYWLIGKKSKLSISNKLLLYKQIVRPTWAYGAQIWGCAARSNIEILQRVQNRALRQIVGARWYERNSDIHRDLGMETVSQFITKVATNYERRLHHHPNTEALLLLDNSNEFRRLKRVKPWELASPLV